MIDRRARRALGLMLTAALVAGCTPQASDSLTLPGGVTNAQLFACAESALGELRRTDEQWTTRITLRDTGRGHFETGDFPEPNVMGYRIRVVREGSAPRAALHVRAAGPYFTDLGADDAMRALKKSLTACLGPARPVR